MNVTSRPGPASGNTNHSVVTNVQSNMTSNANAAPNHIQNSNTSKNSANNLMNMFHGSLSVPRHMMVQARGARSNQHAMIHLNFVDTIGQGTFGQIERAVLTIHPESNTDSKNSKADENALQVAVKRVLQDPRYKNRELGIMQRLNPHPNIVKFYYYYYSTTPSNNAGHRGSSNRSSSSTSGLDLFLHLVLECFPENLCELICRYAQRDAKLPTHMVKVFTYQMLKALAYLHSHQICHRDIKSSNLLVNESTLVLKVCDFGSAKEMVPGTANVSYISSRYYRAPELLFGAQMYTCAIDTWSGGCVLAEMLRQRCLFMGADSVDQLVKVIRVLGTPSLDDIASMNPLYRSYSFPKVLPCPVSLFFPQHTPTDLLDLMQAMLVFNPSLRISPLDALQHSSFNELRELGPNGLLPGRIRVPAHMFDPNPDPTPPTNQTEPLANSNTWNQSDSRYWSVSNRKSNEAPGSDEKKMKKNSGSGKSQDGSANWQNRARPSTGSNKSDIPPTTELISSAKQLGETVSIKKSNSKRGEDSSRQMASDSEKLNNSNNGTNTAPAASSGPSSSSLDQPPKYGGVNASGNPEIDHLAEISS